MVGTAKTRNFILIGSLCICLPYYKYKNDIGIYNAMENDMSMPRRRSCTEHEHNDKPSVRLLSTVFLELAIRIVGNV